MKEITRIHIAKVAYDSELDAKKDLENYVKALERYANDQEILADIEIRITELLSEQGIAAGGVITKEDVAAIRAQLGEPSDFASDDELAGAAIEASAESRRMYRDENDAILGGVLAGFGKFFGIDPLWVRLLFIVLLFASFGTALLVYLILWIIIPPARSAAEKLQMSGQPVTLSSIKALAGTDGQFTSGSRVVRRILSVVAGIGLLLLAIGGIMAVGAGIFGLRDTAGSLFTNGVNDPFSASLISSWVIDSWWFTTMVWFFAASGLLFTALCSVLAYTAFRQHWTKRIGNAVIAIIVSGIVVFSSGVGAGMYGYFSERSHADAMYESVTHDTPQGFQNIKHLTVASRGSGSELSVDYIVSDEPQYKINGIAGPELNIVMSKDGLSATVIASVVLGNRTGEWKTYNSFSSREPSIQIYGPALDSVELDSGPPIFSYSTDTTQEQLSVTATSNKEFSLFGSYNTVSLATKGPGLNARLDSTSVGTLNVKNMEKGSNVSAGDVKTLNLTQTEACMLRGELDIRADRSIQLQSISSGKITSNGEEQPVDYVLSREVGCVMLFIQHSYEGTNRSGVLYENN